MLLLPTLAIVSIFGQGCHSNGSYHAGNAADNRTLRVINFVLGSIHYLNNNEDNNKPDDNFHFCPLLVETSQVVQHLRIHREAVTHRNIAQLECRWQRWILQAAKQLVDVLLDVFADLAEFHSGADCVMRLLDFFNQNSRSLDKCT